MIFNHNKHLVYNKDMNLFNMINHQDLFNQNNNKYIYIHKKMKMNLVILYKIHKED